MQIATGPQDKARLALLSQQGREECLFEKAFLEPVVDRRPDWDDAVRALAGVYTALGFFHDGLLLDERAVRLCPEDAGAHYDLACSRALTGDVEGAFAALTEACHHGYSDRVHMAKDIDLRSLHQDFRFAELLRMMEPSID